jgi:Holliday junction resolvase
MRRAPLEKTIVANVMAQGRALGWWVTKIHGSAYSTAGIPDVLAIKDGRAAWLECKRPGEEPTKIQLHRMRELSAAGCPVAVVTSAADARAFLENVV